MTSGTLSAPRHGPGSGPGSEPGTHARDARTRRLVRPAAALASGAVLSTAFAPLDLWPIAPIALAALLLTLHGRSGKYGAWLGFLAGIGFFVPLLTWLHVIGTDAWFGLAVVQSVYFALLGSGLAVVTRLPAWPLWSACVWVGEELVRDRWPLGGFPWGRVAFSQGHTPFTPYAALAGAVFVTFVVAVVAGLLAYAVLTAWRTRNAIAGGGALVRPAIAVVVALALPAIGLAIPTPTGSARHVTVAVVQGNVPHPGMHFLGRPMQVLDNHVTETERLAAQVAAGTVPKPDIVIWPENASDLDPFDNPEAMARITHAVRTIGVPVLVGAILDGPGPDHARNTGIVWDPVTGPGAEYAKRHPVPFGEYVPWRSVLDRFIGRLSLVPRDYVPGHTNGVMQLGPARIGDIICFEVAYDELVRDTVDGGAQLIVVQTNNATYMHTPETYQQLAMSQLRAVEHGRAVVISATSGVSAVIAPDGSVVASTPQMVADTLVERVPLRTQRTLADRLGVVPEWTLASLGLLAGAVGVTLHLSARRRRENADDAPEQ